MLHRSIRTGCLLLLTIPSLAMAQRAHGGQPWAWGNTVEEQLVAHGGPGLLPAHGEEDGALQRPHAVDVLTQGTWDRPEPGTDRCRFMVESAGAAMLALQFERFAPGSTGRVYLYDRMRTRFLGGFIASNAVEGGLATAVLPGDAVVVEYLVPVGDPRGELRLAGLTHFHRSIHAIAERGLGPSGLSAPCQVDIECAPAWSDQKRSVALFVRPDGGGCTGTLLNNTAQNGVPYFLTAKHCYQANEHQWVFYFNYDSPECGGGAGPTDHTLTGAVLVASTELGDLVLLRLHDTPPAEYNVYYSGWDRSNVPTPSGAAIHHPRSDVKKINTFTTPAVAVVPEGGPACWQVDWTTGVAEGGTSGAALFNAQRRVVGFAYDGQQTCGSTTDDPSLFTKFSYNWDGSSPSGRLRDWPDPGNTVQGMNGLDPVGTPPPVLGCRVSLRTMLEGPYQGGAMRTDLRAAGVLPQLEPYTALGYVHVGDGGGETMSVAAWQASGSAAIVDWVVVELRSAAQPEVIVATRSALLRSDGMVVDVDGNSPVFFPTAPWGNYYLGLHHRNHLGVVTSRPQVVGQVVQTKNFINGSTELRDPQQATRSVGGILCQWAGDASGNGVLSYTGPGNDRDRVLTRIGGTVPTAVVAGYHREDLDLDGYVRYTGAGNDREIILQNIGGTLPTGTRIARLP